MPVGGGWWPKGAAFEPDFAAFALTAYDNPAFANKAPV